MTADASTMPIASPDEDYTMLPSATQVMFGPNSESENVEIQITNDQCLKNVDMTTDDFGEMFKVVLETNTDGSCSGQTVTLCDGRNAEAVVTIDNDDGKYMHNNQQFLLNEKSVA